MQGNVCVVCDSDGCFVFCMLYCASLAATLAAGFVCCVFCALCWQRGGGCVLLFVDGGWLMVAGCLLLVVIDMCRLLLVWCDLGDLLLLYLAMCS